MPNFYGYIKDSVAMARIVLFKIKNADKEAVLEAKSSNGNTPLHTAAICDSTRVAELLLKAGARANPKNGNCKTPLQLAIENKKPIVEKLLRNKTD